MIIAIFLRKENFKAVLSPKVGDGIMAGILILNLFLAVYAIRHLPYIDFRPYKVGNHIPSLMEPSEAYKYKYIMEKEGDEFEFETYPTDTTFKYKDMILLNPEAQPKITDYHVWTDEGDYTEETFAGDKMLVVFYDITKSNVSHLDELKRLISELDNTVDVWALTASDGIEFEAFRHEYQLSIPYYFADMTVLEAIIRSNPGIWLLKDGVVMGKWHHNDIPEGSEVNAILKK
jgi:hypothetical protein